MGYTFYKSINPHTMSSKAQIIATIGPSSSDKKIFLELARHNLDVARLNFSWGNENEKTSEIALVRETAKELGKRIPIIQDLPGPRVQKEKGHTYEEVDGPYLTERDRRFIDFGAQQKIDYVALSFVGSAQDVLEGREAIKASGGSQKIIAKIERKKAVDALKEIIIAADAIMIARGDLGQEFPLEQIPFVQAMIIKECNKAGKPVITATEMMMSMTMQDRPARADVTDVANAILLGSDCVMLSEETASGKYPVETVIMMEKIVLEAEKHVDSRKPNILL